MHNKYNFIKDEPDYSHLTDKETYKLLYEEVGTVPANQEVKWREEWMKHFIPAPNSTILELGSHNGPNLIYYAQRGHNIVGVELSETLINVFNEVASQENKEIRDRMTVHHSWIEEFEVAEKFDYVLCTEILEHVINPVDVLKTAAKHLKDSGEVYISSPANHWGNNTHVRGVPENDLKDWLHEAGLEASQLWVEDNRTFCIAKGLKIPKVYGMLRVRNESKIVNDTLDYMSDFCTGGIVVYDDCSEDDTEEICKNHPSVIEVVNGTNWDSDRARAEFENRASLLSAVKNYAHQIDWLVHQDADERIEFDWTQLQSLDDDVIAIKMKLYDYYITEEDADKKYTERNWLGPEYREIVMAFRNLPTLSYNSPDQREVTLGMNGTIIVNGYVKHYGKAISIEDWEKKCDYYANHFPMYSEKWKNRKGKAVHKNLSDFGRDLITWNEKEKFGIDLMKLTSDSALANVERKLNILLTTHHLNGYTGSEILTLTLALALKESGHNVTVYSKYLDKIREEFDHNSIRITEDIASLRNEHFDVAHVHHNINAIEVRYYFPTLPIVFYSQGVLPFLEQPPIPEVGIYKYLALSEETKDNIISGGIEENKISIIRNFIDHHLFECKNEIKDFPQKALILSGRLDSKKEKIIRGALTKLNIESIFIGGRFGNVQQEELRRIIGECDIVFSLGRGAIESMLCGRVPLIFDYLGGDGLVTPESFNEIKKYNFSGRRYKYNFSVEELISEINKYKKEYGIILRERAIKEYSVRSVLPGLLNIYYEAVKSVTPIRKIDFPEIESYINVINETRNYAYDLGRKHYRRELKQKIQYDQLFHFAEELINSEKISEAKNLLETLQVINEDDLNVLSDLAVVNIIQENYEDAVQFIDKVLKIDPNDEIALSNLNYLKNELEKISKQPQILTESNTGADQQQVPRMYNENENGADSIENSSPNENTEFSELLIKAEEFIEENKYVQAEEILKEILFHNKEDVNALNDLAVICILKDEPLAAIKYLKSIEN